MLTTNCTMYYSTHAHLSNPTNENESDTLWYKEFFPMQVHQIQTIPEFFSHFTLNVNISSCITKLNCTSVAFIPGSFLYTGLPIFNCIISYWAFSYYLCTILTISFKRVYRKKTEQTILFNMIYPINLYTNCRVLCLVPCRMKIIVSFSKSSSNRVSWLFISCICSENIAVQLCAAKHATYSNGEMRLRNKIEIILLW